MVIFQWYLVVGTTMLLQSILFVIYVSIADSAIPDECTTTLNHSDCGLRPTMVYTNFSPMSMCHPAIWRGCPTKNKFATEFQCMESCLADEDSEVNKERCDVPLNTSRCSSKKKLVYTFDADKGECVKAWWHGCQSENIFSKKTSCINTCTTIMEWEDKLAKMDITELKETSKLLNYIIKKFDAPDNKPDNSGKTIKLDSLAKAYFIRKLQKVNKELDARTENGNT